MQAVRSLGDGLSRLTYRLVRVVGSSSLLAAAVVTIMMDWPEAYACSFGPLDSFKVGQSLTTIVDHFGACGGDVVMDRYDGRQGRGVVLCAAPGRDSPGRRLLIVNGRVVAIRQGQGMKEFCSWGRTYRSD